MAHNDGVAAAGLAETHDDRPAGPRYSSDTPTNDFINLTSPDRRGLARLPGLDGLRGVAVLAVLAFHAGFQHMVGGYLGVSTFFTLSGFLIGSLLISESRRTGRVSLREFWGRRFRRLMPAALATLGGIMLVFAPLAATPDQRETMGRGVLAAVFDVFNWKLIRDGTSYTQLFTAPSPVLHFWSLSIEEQFYIFFPVVLLGLWLVTRGRRPLVLIVVAAATAFFVIEPHLFSMSHDRIYFGTDTRAPSSSWESSWPSCCRPNGCGATGAGVALAHRGPRRRASRPARSNSGAGGGSSRPHPGSTEAASRSTPCCRASSSPPPRFRPDRCGPCSASDLSGGRDPQLRDLPAALADLPGNPPDGPEPVSMGGTVIGVSAAFVLAELSFRILERPVQLRRWPAPGKPAAAFGAVGILAVAALSFLPWPVDKSQLVTDFAAEQQHFEQLGTGPAPVNPTTTAVASPVAPPPHLTMFGDSTVYSLSTGISEWAKRTGSASFDPGEATVGCPLVRYKEIKTFGIGVPPAFCEDWANRWPGVIDKMQPDAVILEAAPWNTSDVIIPGDTKVSSMTDPATAAFVKQEVLDQVDLVASTGKLAILMTYPRFVATKTDGPDRDPARMARYNQILAEVAAERPDTVRLLDFAGWLGDRSQDKALRPDGTHFTDEAATRLTNDWIGNQILTLWNDWWQMHRAPAAAGGTGSGTASGGGP